MRRFFPLAFALTMIPAIAPAETFTDIDWQLLAIDGTAVGLDVVASLRIGADGTIRGKAPCNGFGSRNQAVLPALALGGIRATRMACDKLQEEQAFFNALSRMTTVVLDGPENLILTGSDGQSMEFVIDRMNNQTVCKSCPPKC